MNKLALLQKNFMKKLLLYALLCGLGACTNKKTEPDLTWKPLFNGKDIKDFVNRNQDDVVYDGEP